MQLGTAWQYVGTGRGRGMVHMVVWIDAHEIITWSAPCLAGGFCWAGSRDEFYRDFRRVTK